MAAHVKFTDSERREIAEAVNSGKRARGHVYEGEPITEIAKRYNVTRETIYRVARRYQAEQKSPGERRGQKVSTHA